MPSRAIPSLSGSVGASLDSSRSMKMLRWSRTSLAPSEIASRAVTEPSVHTSTVSLS